jgi:hypothetical protein
MLLGTIMIKKYTLYNISLNWQSIIISTVIIRNPRVTEMSQLVSLTSRRYATRMHLFFNVALQVSVLKSTPLSAEDGEIKMGNRMKNHHE